MNAYIHVILDKNDFDSPDDFNNDLSSFSMRKKTH